MICYKANVVSFFRSELGKIALDKVFRERESLNDNIVESINNASEAWGITCFRYEIRKYLIFYYQSYFTDWDQKC